VDSLTQKRVLSLSLSLLILLMSSLVPLKSWAIDVAINGVDSSDIRENITLFIKQLDLPVSEFDVDDFENKATNKAQKAIQAFGYYNADIDVVPVQYAKNGDFTLTLNITLKQITVVNRVILQADFMRSSNEQTQNMPQKLLSVIEQVRAMQGRPLNHDLY
jgi:translocation and assembly module TamA